MSERRTITVSAEDIEFSITLPADVAERVEGEPQFPDGSTMTYEEFERSLNEVMNQLAFILAGNLVAVNYLRFAMIMLYGGLDDVAGGMIHFIQDQRRERAIQQN